ncbi:glutamate formimidoyltransferase [Cryomorphaceae bacterium 1068]|nr:glutamate formimidoyltransferase [Cryomorphaceae bacterium 1068]
MSALIECVPNISEGRDPKIIKEIASVVETVEGVKLLDVDPGKSTNRTVITFVGAPEPVIEAAFRLIKKASELIDMRKQKGEHPRMGATDVCPLVPISGIEMEEVAKYAHKLGERVGRELGIPGYFYENAAKEPKRKNLAYCRSGEYEGLDKLSKPEWKPDFGPAEFNDSVKGTGATAISARDFLVAYNVNLNTTSARRANAIAFDIREAGRVKKDGDGLTGKVVTDENGEPVRIPGTLKAVKGIGWYIEEYGIAQLSLNLTNIKITPVHKAFDEACEKARDRGIRVTGSEIVGLVPLQSLLDAADYFLKKQERSLGISESEKVKIAVKSLGLDDLTPFDPYKKVIEYMIKDDSTKKLVDMSLTAFADETASESPAPGGGSVSAYIGSLGISLATMVANLSSHKRGWDDRWSEFSQWAEKGQELKEKLIAAVDEDTAAFNEIMKAFGMPKDKPEEIQARKKAISDATKYAAEVPLKVARLANESFGVIKAMVEIGNPNSITDAGVGALCARAAVKGAAMNVRINLKGFNDLDFVSQAISEVEKLEKAADEHEKEINKKVMKAIA